MKKRARLAIAALVFVLGAALIAYPYVSDYVHKQQRHEVISVQEEVVDETGDAELADEMVRAQDYNKRLLSSKTVVTDPFDPDAQRVTSEEYESLLNLNGDGVMGTLVIPKIDLQMPIYHYTNDEELQEGVGHMEATSLPVGGPSTHAVLAGHNGLPMVKIFDRLDELEVGDYFVIEVLGEDHAYRVTGKETVLPEETESLVVQDGKDLVTLVTCTPYGVNTHRLLVHAERCELPADWGAEREQTAAASAEAEVPLLEFTLVGLAIAAGLGVSWAIARRRRAARRAAAASVGKHFASGGSSRPRADATADVRTTGAAGVKPVPVRRSRGRRGGPRHG